MPLNIRDRDVRIKIVLLTAPSLCPTVWAVSPRPARSLQLEARGMETLQDKIKNNPNTYNLMLGWKHVVLFCSFVSVSNLLRLLSPSLWPTEIRTEVSELEKQVSQIPVVVRQRLGIHRWSGQWLESDRCQPNWPDRQLAQAEFARCILWQKTPD